MVRSKTGQVPHPFPYPVFVILIIAWFMGRYHDKSVQLSMRDALTGLYNRRFVMKQIEKMMRKANRRQQKIAVMLLDVNDFKDINDQFGHEYGDKVLAGIAELIQNSFDKKDIAARWGGDEFLIISSFSDERAVETKISQFKSKLINRNWQFNKGVSVSLGKGIFPDDGDEFHDLVEKADSNMYKIKLKSKQMDDRR